MTTTQQSTPPTPGSLRVLRKVMRRDHALEFLVDYCALTAREAAQLLDGCQYPPARDSRGGRAVQPGSVDSMRGRVQP